MMFRFALLIWSLSLVPSLALAQRYDVRGPDGTLRGYSQVENGGRWLVRRSPDGTRQGYVDLRDGTIRDNAGRNLGSVRKR
jgi:hypothetical protein